jgi:hypothetical protein
LYNQDLDPNNDDDVLVGSTINPSDKEKTPTEASQESPKNLEQATRENSDYMEVTGNPNNESKLEDKSIIYQKRKQESSRASSASDYFKTKTPINESRGELLEEFITPEINAEDMRKNYGK